MRWWRRRSLRWGGMMAIISVLAVALSWWRTRPDGQLHVIFPELSGDMVLIVTPHGKTIVVDGSADAVGATSFIGTKLPFWQRSLDLVILTHADDQRLAGILALSRRYYFGTVIMPKLSDAGQDQALHDELIAQKHGVKPIKAGTSVMLDGVQIKILQADTRNGGMIVLVSYDQFHALLAPYVDDDQALQLLNQDLKADLLWWAWTRPDERDLANHVQAKIVIYSAGSGAVQNPRTYFARGSGERRLLHEEVNGMISIISDGRRTWIETER